MRKLLLYIAITLLFSAITAMAGDKTAPVVTVTTDSCGNYTVKIAELAAGDVGVYFRPKPKSSNCYNVSSITLSPNFKDSIPNYDFYFTFHVINPLDSASLYILITDGMQNAVTKIINYVPKMEVLPESFNFFASLVDDTSSIMFVLRNNHWTTKIIDMKFRKGIYYEVSGPKAFTLNPDEQHNFYISYFPKTDNGTLDIDTLDIFTSCENISYTINLSGYGVKPLIQVENIDFGFVRIGETINLSDIRGSDSAITISNPGTSSLYLSKYKLLNGKYFKISSPPNPELNGYTVFPKDSVLFKSIELFAGIPGRINDTLVISSNAKGPDSIAVLTAYAVYPGAYLTEYNFGDKRLLTSDSGIVIIRNNSRIPIQTTGIVVIGDTNDIKVQYSKISTIFEKDKIFTLYPETFDSTHYLTQIKIPLSFKPLTEFNKRIKITLKIADDDTSTTEVFNYVSGRGTIPKVFAEGHDFQPKILAGTKYPDVQYIKITNTSTSSDMILYKVEPIYSGNFGENFFTFPQPLPVNLTVAKGQTISIPVEFYPMTDGSMSLNIKISTNCNLYNSPEYLKDTTVILTGAAYKTPVNIEQTILPTINKCSSGIITVKMTNVNFLDAIRIDSMKIPITADNVFSFADTSISHGFDMAPAGEYLFNIIYNPSKSDQSLHREIINYYYTNHIYGFEIFADCFSSNISIILDTIYNVRPGVRFNPETGKKNRYLIKIKSENFTGVNADSFELKLLYNPGQLQFTDQVFATDGMELWNLTTKTSNIGPEETILSIIGHTPIPQQKFEGILYPAFEIVLSDTNEVLIRAEELIINDNSKCFTTNLGLGKIFMNDCALQMGRLVLSNYGFNMMTIVPNPVSADVVTIKFSVAFRALTSIEFYNTEGNLIYTLLNKYLEPGDYEMQFSVKDVPAGTYLVKFKSGFFNNSQQIIIIK